MKSSSMHVSNADINACYQMEYTLKGCAFGLSPFIWLKPTRKPLKLHKNKLKTTPNAFATIW